MARIAPLSPNEADAATQAEYEKILASTGRLTNMKKTLGHSLPALRALMQWYPLRDEVQAFLGSRATTLFVHAISTQTDCLICSTFFRRALVEMGEDPDRFTMNQQESTLVEFARQLVDDPNRVDDSLYGRLAEFLDPPQIVVLTTFGAIMIATNTFNNALNVDLDVELEQYRRPATRAETS